MIPFRAVAVDMDGTFLNQNSDYNHPLFEQVFKKLTANNIHFIIASGNELRRCQHDMSKWANGCDYVCENGSLVASKGKIIYRHYLEPAVVKKAVKFIQTNYSQAKIILSAENHAYILRDNDAHFKDMFYHSYVTGEEVADFTNCYDQVFKITLNCSIQKVIEIENAFAQKYSREIKGISGSGPWMDLINPDDDKSRGLAILLDYLHIPLNKLMVFGDGGNDVKMLEMTPLSFAMANGTEQAKAAAKHIAPANTEDGVLKTLLQYL